MKQSERLEKLEERVKKLEDSAVRIVVQDPVEPDKRCGTCRYFDAILMEAAPCSWAPQRGFPDAVSWNRHLMSQRDGKDCPCWEGA